jgi:hypothetical protein
MGARGTSKPLLSSRVGADAQLSTPVERVMLPPITAISMMFSDRGAFAIGAIQLSLTGLREMAMNSRLISPAAACYHFSQ